MIHKGERSCRKLRRSGLDLAKYVFQLHGPSGSGRAVSRQKLRRGQVLAFFSSRISPSAPSHPMAPAASGPVASPSSGRHSHHSHSSERLNFEGGPARTADK